MAEALALVRGDLGSDAVILHTRSYKRGGVLGLGAKPVVEITAGSGKAVGLHRRQANQRKRAHQLAKQASTGVGTSVPMSKAVTPRQPLAAAAKAYQAYARSSSAASAMTPPAGHFEETDRKLVLPSTRPPVGSMDAAQSQQDMAAGDLIRRTYAVARAELESARAKEARHTQASIHAQADPVQLAAEMQAVKRMVARMMRQQNHAGFASRAVPGPGSTTDLPDPLVDHYAALLQQEVAQELAEEVVAQVRGRLDDQQATDDQACREAMAHALADLLPTAGQDAGVLKPTPDGRPRIITLVGPTGVGKTTTLAKLAATFKLKQNKNVALITLDTYRIAAVDQLRTYAQIIGLPLHVVLTPDDLRHALTRCADCDAVLIDTAGRSQRDGERLEELSGFIEAADPHEVHLVLSSTCSQSVLMEAVDRFSRIRTDSIIFTKLDEAVSFGVLLNVLRSVNKQLSYITTGQEVPHQIEPGDCARLAALVMGQGRVQS